MTETNHEGFLSGQGETLFLFGVIALLFNWIAWQNEYYKLPKHQSPLNVRFEQVLCVFAIYFGVLFLGNILLRKFFGTFFNPTPLSSGIFQLITSCFVLLLLFIYLTTQEKSLVQKIWKDTASQRSLFFDFGIGVLTWFISYPLVTVIGTFTDLVVVNLFHIETHEQIVVQYLKAVFHSPFLLTVMLLLILIIAPITEELLFRGFLQNFFKKHLGRKASILLSSFFFALFHYSQGQGGGNISLIVSLFTFACFLGFIYERQNSLLANIALHMTFNFSTVMLITFEL